MSETIWRATDADGKCYEYHGHRPAWNKGRSTFADTRDWLAPYLGPNKPPPGECWEIVQTRKGEQPTGEAWERLVDAAGAYTKEYRSQRSGVRELARELMDAFTAYEADQSAEPNDKQATIAELQEQIRKLKVESATQTDAISEREDRIDQLSGEVQRLTAKIAKPEMPECVRELVDAVCLEFPGFFAKKIAAVEAHYAPPFRITGPGVYSAKLGKDKELVIRLFHHRQDGWLGYFDGTGAVWLFDDSGRAGGVQLTKLLRPLEG